jgi:hypothetical protein
MLRSLALALALFAATPASAGFGPEGLTIWGFFAWAETNWIGTAITHGRPAAWNGSWSKSTVLHLEEGGFIHEHMRRWRQLGQSDADVEIRGPCFSACTLIIAVVPKERLCFGDYASLQFHAASDLSGRIAIPATMWMLRQYPRDIYDWLMARGGAPGMTVYDFWVLEAPELWAMGYRRCAPERAPLMTIDQTKKRDHERTRMFDPRGSDLSRTETE